MRYLNFTPSMLLLQQPQVGLKFIAVFKCDVLKVVFVRFSAALLTFY